MAEKYSDPEKAIARAEKLDLEALSNLEWEMRFDRETDTEELMDALSLIQIARGGIKNLGRDGKEKLGKLALEFLDE